jgi:hypothetical protein
MIRVFLVEDEPPAMRKLERLAAAESEGCDLRRRGRWNRCSVA